MFEGMTSVQPSAAPAADTACPPGRRVGPVRFYRGREVERPRDTGSRREVHGGSGCKGGAGRDRGHGGIKVRGRLSALSAAGDEANDDPRVCPGFNYKLLTDHLW